MTGHQCGSCSYGSNDLDELRQHKHQTGHVGFCENDGVNTPGAAEVVEDAEPSGGKSGKGRIAAAAAVGLGVATVLGTLAWKYMKLKAENDELAAENGELKAENGELKSLAGGLLAEVAELVTENDYLKSASGAGTTLRGYGN
ncbi:hypothetical protein ACFU5Y_08105 [Streptomyces gardneri]|uniref:hypothetical protein n=1 Tax=Streptomyces gardneri TaxID=66892 RepID=UPI003677FEF1